MTDLKIVKVKLIKHGEKVLINFEKDGEMKSDGGETFKERAHVDFTNAVNSLACHLGILTDYITEKRASNKEELEKFVVTGYSLSGDEDEDEQGIVITGYRITKSGKTVTLNTPFLRLSTDPKEYYLIEDLKKCVEMIDFEAREYMGGKIAPREQLELEMPDENVTKMQIVPPGGDEPDNDNSDLFADEGAKLIIESSNQRSAQRAKNQEQAIHFRD